MALKLTYQDERDGYGELNYGLFVGPVDELVAVLQKLELEKAVREKKEPKKKRRAA